MLDFINSLSDDQFAILGCVTALLICGIVMSLSYYIGQFFNVREAEQIAAPWNQNIQQQGVHTSKAA